MGVEGVEQRTQDAALGDADVEGLWLPILTTCGLPVKKLWTQEQSKEFNPRSLSLVTRLWGTMVLNAEL